MFDLVLAFGRVLGSTVVEKGKSLLYSVRVFEPLESVPDTEAECAPDQVVYGALGIISRPDPPDAGGATEVVIARTGDGAEPIASRDLRLNKRTNPKEGETLHVQYGGGFLSLKWNLDRAGTTIALLAPQLDGSGEISKSHVLSLDTQAAKPSVVLGHLLGHALIMNHEKEAYLCSSNGQHMVGVSDDGVLISGIVKMLGGVVAGDTTLAQPVALAPALAAFAAGLPALLATIDACFAGASAPAVTATSGITAGQYAAFQTARAAIETLAAAVAAPATGASQTLKASPI